MKSQLEYFESIKSLSLKGNRLTPMVAFASGKGGVGKTTLITSVAVSMAEKGKKVLLLDGDPGMADLHILLGRTPDLNWSHFLNGSQSLRDIIETDLHGVDLIHGFSGMPNLDWASSGAMHSVLSEVDSISMDYDIVLIDVGAGVNEVSIALTTFVDQVYLVVTPDFTSIADAHAALKTTLKWNPGQNVEVLVNRCSTVREGENTHRSFSSVSQKFLGSTPNLAGVFSETKKVSLALLEQVPLVKSFKNCELAKEIEKFAEVLSKTKLEV